MSTTSLIVRLGLPTQDAFPLPQIPEINLGDKTKLTKQAADAVELAKSMDVDSPAMAQEMQTEVASWGAAADAVEACRMGYTRPFDDAKKLIMDHFRTEQANFEEAREIGRRKLGAFAKAEAERVRRAEQEAAERARQERARQEAEAREKQRQAAEEAAKAEAARKAAEKEKDAQKKLELEREADAAAMKAQEHQQDASTALAVAEVTTPRAIAPAAKIAGASNREVVLLAVEDKLNAAKWFVEHPMFIDVLEFNESKLKAMQKSLGDNFAVPGIKVTKDLNVAAARR